MPLPLFHPLIRDWFVGRFGEPTEPQRRAWPHIAAGENTLIAAPTGSGKTLSAFLVCLDKLARKWLNGRLDETIQVVYVSPLKALSNDIERNLQTPLEEIRALAAATGHEAPPIRVAVRSGDTPARQRLAMLKHPPHILVTTPESLYLLLTSAKSRELLRSVETIIVDEIHALARDKRGSHLTLSLERLAALCERPPTRIGLSATQRPMDAIARFLVGAGVDVSNTQSQQEANASRSPKIHSPRIHQPPATSHQIPATSQEPPCNIIDVGHVRHLDLALETPESELSAVCSNEQWGEIDERIVELINTHRSTLIFVNTRRMAERVAHHLTEILGDDAVASHHGSLSREIRLSAEQRLKNGQLKAIVATASLELGIDIGYIDLVLQIGSPRSIATFLQRVGRSGHNLRAIPKGRLIPLTRDELLESLALVRAVRRGELDQIEIPDCPLDILAQQIVAAVACEDWNEGELFHFCRRAWPFRNLGAAEYEAILCMLSEGVHPATKRGAYLHRDRIHGRLRARRGARLAAITSGGAIPENGEYRVVAEPDETFVGTVDEDFAIDSSAGDIFLLGNTSWRIRYVRGGEVRVSDAEGAPPTIPFWFGEAPGRTVELSAQISTLRWELAERVTDLPAAEDWLRTECNASDSQAGQAARYVEAQHAALGLVPTNDQIVFERFFDESGGMQLVIHAPLGTRINRAWGLALRKRFCRSFDFELQAAADDDGIVLSLSPQHSFPVEKLFQMLRPDNGQDLLEQAVLVVPMFQVRWRWNVTRSLAVLRRSGGKKVPPYLQKFRSEDLLSACFPETVGCLENHHGDIVIPSHPLVQQTMHDCLHEAMDVTRWLELLGRVQSGEVKLIARDTREPSPFCHELLNANPYAFLDDAPLEERRTRAVSTRRSFSAEDVRDLARLDPEAIAQVREEAWPLVRSADELHDALLSIVCLHAHEGEPWQIWFDELVRDGRVTTVAIPVGIAHPGVPVLANTLVQAIAACDSHVATSGPLVEAGTTSEPLVATFWIAAERWPLISAMYNDAVAEPPVSLPSSLSQPVERSKGWVELARGRMQHGGPTTAAKLAAEFVLAPSNFFAALEALEGEGVVLRGRFSEQARAAGEKLADEDVEWCERRLLARIHRLTLSGLRKRIQPVEPSDYLRFLAKQHRLGAGGKFNGPVGLREAVALLEGYELPAGAWERHVLAVRVADYESEWLDHLFLSGELVWGRLRPPRRDEADGPSMAALTRTVPISLVLREDLPWLLPENRPAADDAARSNAADVLAALNARGALFFPELKSLTGLLPAHLEEALRELAALGLVTSDAFAAVRSIVEANHKHASHQRRRRNGRVMHGLASPVGRWSRFPGAFDAPTREARLEKWCRLLVRRYGVLFRELLTRESAAPSWHELVPTLRRMELKGELRGGRFVAKVGGEQFAAEHAIEALRQARDEPPSGEWLILSAADPLNLAGILGGGPRITATHKNALILQDGRYIAARQAGEVEFLAPVEPVVESEMRDALTRGQRRKALATAGQSGSLSPFALRKSVLSRSERRQ